MAKEAGKDDTNAGNDENMKNNDNSTVQPGGIFSSIYQRLISRQSSASVTSIGSKENPTSGEQSKRDDDQDHFGSPHGGGTKRSSGMREDDPQMDENAKTEESSDEEHDDADASNSHDDTYEDAAESTIKPLGAAMQALGVMENAATDAIEMLDRVEKLRDTSEEMLDAVQKMKVTTEKMLDTVKMRDTTKKMLDTVKMADAVVEVKDTVKQKIQEAAHDLEKENNPNMGPYEVQGVAGLSDFDPITAAMAGEIDIEDKQKVEKSQD